MISLKRILLAVSFIYLPFAGFAWGLLGHRIVGQIAETHLTPAAKSAILKILGTESIAMSANWADFIKSDSTFDYLDTWHYINLKAGLSKHEAMAVMANDSLVNAYTKINFLAKELKKKKLSKGLKVMYLKLLIHIVGDIHQPLHVGRPEDRGGNNVKVLWFNAPNNLHSVWDSYFINHQQLSYTEYATALNHSSLAQRIAWQKEPLSEWIYQSYVIAEKIYGHIKQPDQKLGYDYIFKFQETLNQQLLKGGVHLAGLLNEIFRK